ncbi:MAG: efflux RND transporter permease subunit, partial [Cyclonatronaceae bacterium]
MSLSAKSVKRPIATTMVFLIVITLGMIGFRFLPVDLLPPIEYPQLTVNIDYSNVGPAEMEQIITDRVENAIAGIPNIERVTSRSGEGNSRVSLHFAQGTNLDEAANDLRAALDRVRSNLPDEAEAPRIWKFDPNDAPIVIVGAKSEREMAELTRILDREINKRFEQLKGVGAIDIWGGVYSEIHIDLMRDRLLSSNLTANDVIQALNRENVNLPGGNVKEGLSDLYIRTLGEYTSVDQIANTIIRVVDGSPIRVRDVAMVELGYQDVGRYVEIDEQPTIRIGIRKTSGANTVEVARLVREEVAKVNSERDDLELQVITDQSDFIQSSIDNVRNAAVWGGILAVIVLFAFLRNGSTTLIIAISIPISIIATFALLYFNGLTLNQMSFGGLALGVGLIVDNAIVVLENIVRQRQRGKNLEESALVGTKQVAGAIIASTLTTSVIFLPVLFMQTITGLLFQELALVVVFALLCSLLVALTLVPMLSSKFLTFKPDNPDPSKRPAHQRFFEGMEHRYGKILESSLRRKGVVAGSTLVLLIASVMLFPLIPFELAPQTDSDEVQVSMRLDEGTNITVMYDYLLRLDDAVQVLVPQGDVLYFTREVRSNRASVELTLKDQSERRTTAVEIADHLRSNLQDAIPGADIQVSARSGLWILRRVFSSGGDGESVQMQLRGYDLALAEQIAMEMSTRIETLDGIADVRASEQEGRPEQNIRFDRERIAQLGIGVQDIASALQTNIGGRRAGYYRVDGEEIPITVRLRPEDRLSLQDLDNITVRSSAGEILPLSALVSQDMGRGPTNINRVDGQRVTYISANLESGVPLGDAVSRIQTELADYPLPEGFSLYFGGEYEEQQKARRDFILAIIMALVLIYMVMAAQFERFIDPLIVMFSVPLAIIGIVPTMMLTGTTLNLQSFMGIIMLIGIVVNNAIVLVDYINLLRREENLPIHKAVVEAGKLRLRPILLTTVTTVLGLLPLSFGFGAGGEIQAALARVVIGGLTASTLITLVLIPVVYVTITTATERVKEWVASFR